jgi:uncharacterized protein (DUF2267 family)
MLDFVSEQESDMSSTGYATFDTTLQETNLWLKDLMSILRITDRGWAYRVLRATLHALRDRIGPENAVHLGAQLPMLLRGLYYEGWHMAGTPTHERHREAFLDRVRLELPMDIEIDVRDAVCSVFWVMYDRLDHGEISKLIRILPEELRNLWPAIARTDEVSA